MSISKRGLGKKVRKTGSKGGGIKRGGTMREGRKGRTEEGREEGSEKGREGGKGEIQWLV